MCQGSLLPHFQMVILLEVSGLRSSVAGSPWIFDQTTGQQGSKEFSGSQIPSQRSDLPKVGAVATLIDFRYFDLSQVQLRRLIS